MSRPIRTRFAPSPTGFLHVGGLRTALFAYLFARRNNGTFILRIEDTDRERFMEGGIENIVRSLEWAGLIIDEGVLLDEKGNVFGKGEHGPYIQSKRLDVYKQHAETLVENGYAYYCFCSKERLEEVRKAQEAARQATRYDGRCRSLSSGEARAHVANHLPHVIRMKMPDDGAVVCHDLIRGEVRFDNALVDDSVILKSDGYSTYHLASVVDDHLMDITHVIRGEEWLPSTPKHVMLYRMFGWEPPQFAHLSLLVNDQRQKLSKRHGDLSVEDFKEAGYLPEALLNFVAFLGWNPGDEREIFSLAELEKEFSFEKVGKAPAVFHRDKLDWYNQQYIRMMDPAVLAERSRPFFLHKGVEIGNWKLETVVTLEQGRAATLKELVESVGFLFADRLAYEADLLVWKKSTMEETKKNLEMFFSLMTGIPEAEWDEKNLELRIKNWITENGLDTGAVLWPMRVALSGQKNSPGPFEIAALLGKEKTVERLKAAMGHLTARLPNHLTTK